MKKIITNVFYQGSFQILKIILPIITIPIVSRALGPEGVGSFNFINSIVSYFLLVAGLGMDMYGIREIAVVRENKEKLSKKFFELQYFNGFISILVFFCYIFFSLFMEHSELYLIQSLILIGAFFDISWFFAGIEEFKSITISNFIIKITSFILIVLFINGPEDLAKYFLLQSLSILLSQVILWIFLVKKIKFYKVRIEDVFQHFKPAASFFVGKIATTLYMNINKTALGILGTLSMVGIFSLTTNLIFLIVSLVGAVDTVLMPKMSNLQSAGKENKMIAILDKTVHLQLFVTILFCFGLIATSSSLVNWFFGPSFSEASLVLKTLAPLIIIKTLGIAILKQYLMPKNQITYFNISVIAGAVVNIILNIILIPIYGLYGAVIATLLTETLVTGLRIYYLVKLTSFSFNYFQIIKQLFSGVIMVWLVTSIFSSWDQTITTTMMESIVGLISYLTLTYLFRANMLTDFFILKNKNKNKIFN